MQKLIFAVAVLVLSSPASYTQFKDGGGGGMTVRTKEEAQTAFSASYKAWQSASTEKSSCDLAYTNADHYVTQQTERFYDYQYDLWAACTSQEWTDLNNALNLAWNYGSTAGDDYARGAGYMSAADTNHKAGSDAFDKGDWTTAYDKFSISKYDYDGAADNFKFASATYSLASNEAATACIIMNKYVP